MVDPNNTPSSSAKKPSWHRRISHPPRPNLPNLPNLGHINLPSPNGLRTALLGYIGEVETTIRRRTRRNGSNLGPNAAAGPSGSTSARRSGNGAIGIYASGSSASPSGSSQALPETPLDPKSSLTSQPLYTSYPNDNESEEYHEADLELMDQLESLKQDVGLYLSPRPASPARPTPQRTGSEWMRTLPSRLRAVEESISPSSSIYEGHSRTGSRAATWEETQEEDPAYTSLKRARSKLIRLAKLVLPSEHWQGWEKLGWEDQIEGDDTLGQGPQYASRSPGGSLFVNVPDPEVDEEPEYIFPNRTPSAKLNNRPRSSRSHSFHVASSPYSPVRRPVKSRSLSSPGPIEMPPSLDSALSIGSANGLQGTIDMDSDEEDEEFKLLSESRRHPSYGTIQFGPSVKSALAKAQDGKALIEYDDLPVRWRNNEHIITGYRFIPLHASTGPIPLLKSAFAWHNETVNIHSHFIPTILILAFVGSFVYSSPLHDAHVLDTATLVVYLLAAVSCMVSSASWHVLSGCASKKWFEWGACVDYIGIAWLIEASFFVILYNAFYCHPKTVAFYGTLDLLCGFLGSYLPFQAWFNKRKHKKWRIAFFLFLCFTFFGPLGQMFYQYGYAATMQFTAPFTSSAVIYITGLLFYAFHFPECIWPGKFDHWGHSHQIWHAAIVLAVIVHYQAIFPAHAARYTLSCAAPDAGPPLGRAVEMWWHSLLKGF